MNTDHETIERKVRTENPETATRNKSSESAIPFNFYGSGAKWGIICGIAMAMYLFALNYYGIDELIGMKFLKYLILVSILAYGLTTYKNYLAEAFKFKKGILLGLYTTFVSAFSLILMNMVAYLFSDSLAFDKFQVESNSFGDFAVITGALFFEVIVYGMIITFIILQFLKTQKRPV